MSRIQKVVREQIKDLVDSGFVDSGYLDELDQITAREREIPEPKSYEGDRIVKLRRKLHCSQEAFAEVMGVTADTIMQWERDECKPEKTACRFLNVLEREGLEALK